MHSRRRGFVFFNLRKVFLRFLQANVIVVARIIFCSNTFSVVHFFIRPNAHCRGRKGPSIWQGRIFEKRRRLGDSCYLFWAECVNAVDTRRDVLAAYGGATLTVLYLFYLQFTFFGNLHSWVGIPANTPSVGGRILANAAIPTVHVPCDASGYMNSHWIKRR